MCLCMCCSRVRLWLIISMLVLCLGNLVNNVMIFVVRVGLRLLVGLLVISSLGLLMMVWVMLMCCCLLVDSCDGSVFL